MVLADWLLIIKGLLAFPKEIAALVKLLEGTSTERHDKIMEAISRESDEVARTGRPRWDT